MTDVPLVAGSLIGVRSWRLDAMGNLWPVAVRTASPWHPGVNIAICHKGDAFSVCDDPRCPICRGLAPHTFDARCSCGFYGVFSPTHVPYTGYGTQVLAGVIEAYGRLVLGPGGFRASKAKVLALAQVPERSHPDDTWVRTIAHNWQVPWFRNLNVAMAEFPVSNPMQYLEEVSHDSS